MDQLLEKKKEQLSAYLFLKRNIAMVEHLIADTKSGNAEFIGKLIQIVQEKEKKCYEIMCNIESLDSEIEKNIIALKYLCGYTWEEISEKTNYSLRQVYNIHKKALSKMVDFDRPL